MDASDLEQVLQLAEKRHRALVLEGQALEDFLLAYGRIKRRSILSRRQFKKEGRPVLEKQSCPNL